MSFSSNSWTLGTLILIYSVIYSVEQNNKQLITSGNLKKTHVLLESYSPLYKY